MSPQTLCKLFSKFRLFRVTKDIDCDVILRLVFQCCEHNNRWNSTHLYCIGVGNIEGNLKNEINKTKTICTAWCHHAEAREKIMYSMFFFSFKWTNPLSFLVSSEPAVMTHIAVYMGLCIYIIYLYISIDFKLVHFHVTHIQEPSPHGPIRQRRKHLSEKNITSYELLHCK